MQPSAVGFIVHPNWFRKYWHGQNIKIGLTPSPDIHIHVLTRVDTTQGGQRIIGSHNKLIIIAVPCSRWSQSTNTQLDEDDICDSIVSNLKSTKSSLS